MSDLQSQMNAAMEEAQRADQKKREAAEALRARQHEYETANLRGRQSATREQFVYSHRWRVNDFVMWDNRSTMHRGRRFDPNEALI